MKRWPVVTYLMMTSGHVTDEKMTTGRVTYEKMTSGQRLNGQRPNGHGPNNHMSKKGGRTMYIPVGGENHNDDHNNNNIKDDNILMPHRADGRGDMNKCST